MQWWRLYKAFNDTQPCTPVCVCVICVYHFGFLTWFSHFTFHTLPVLGCTQKGALSKWFIFLLTSMSRRG